MEQQIDPIELTVDEAAAIAAELQRLGEPGLTASALLAKMAHKVVRSWAAAFAQQREARRNADAKLIARAIDRADGPAKQAALELLQLEVQDGHLVEIGGVIVAGLEK